MFQLFDRFLFGYNKDEKKRQARLIQAMANRQASELEEASDAEDVIDQHQEHINELRRQVVELQLVNELLINAMQEKLNVSENEIKELYGRIVWEHEREEQRYQSLNKDEQKVAKRLFDKVYIDEDSYDHEDHHRFHGDDPDYSEAVVEDPLSRLALAASGEEIETEALEQSMEDMFCPHCEADLDDHYEVCPWCYSEINWVE